MRDKAILISGGGVAGAALAWGLVRRGFRATVVERAGTARSSGSPVDVRGDALPVVEAMGIAGRLREAATRVRELDFIDSAGRIRAAVRLDAFGGSAGDIELPRGDLARLLLEASRNEAEYIFGDSIAALSETTDGVEVRFESGVERRFDLVVGADGLHSRVRRLGFGPEAEFVRHMGLYVATLPLPDETPDPQRVVLYNSPGRALAVHPARDKAIAAFIFRHEPAPDFDYRDLGQHKRVLAAAYAGQGWRSAELVEKAMAAEDFYFDAVSQVVLDSWSKGRIALLGDAASCLSLFGEGSSLAIAGANVLAEALADGPDHASAFAAYEQRHRRAVAPRQRGVGQAAALMVPRTRAGIVLRNLGARTIAAASGAARLIRGPERLQRRHAR